MYARKLPVSSSSVAPEHPLWCLQILESLALFQASLPWLIQCSVPGTPSLRLPARPSSGATSSEKPSLISSPPWLRPRCSSKSS